MTQPPEIMVALSEANVADLFSLRQQNGESINDIVTRLLEPSTTGKEDTPKQAISPYAKKAHRYVCYVLGEPIYGETLPAVFGNAIDEIHKLDPEVLEQLANSRISHQRAIISKDRIGVHFKSPHLEVAKSQSGWWFSKIVSQEQVTRMLKELCKVAGFEFGVDIRLEDTHRN
ncbi:hypothetical protein [Profundibacter amoris]|uniref:Uncharacterized protein n=1 Tax=Profundibacter amoris TaxID=2171755 RepID=A0A347UEQ0_9RHOB|nr:hypothetical protein [Profundibacter amoris]AXX97328.1 hypothetical protein BAR1_04920 [Profundibacter amoris]